MYPYIKQGENVTIFVDGRPHTITTSHASYDEILDAIRNNDEDTVRELIDVSERILKYSSGNVTIEHETLFWKGEEMHNALTAKMMDMLRDGFDIDPLVNFMDNLMENPSRRAVNELYGFLEKGNMPITSDGYFLAYKRVRDDYTDCHTGKINNSVGQRVTMPRNQVDDVAGNTCSKGLHFCSLDYLSSFGGSRTMILKINPADVVSIPVDYDLTKGRCCTYEVIGEVPNEEAPRAFTSSVMDWGNDYDDDEDDDWGY